MRYIEKRKIQRAERLYKRLYEEEKAKNHGMDGSTAAFMYRMQHEAILKLMNDLEVPVNEQIGDGIRTHRTVWRVTDKDGGLSIVRVQGRNLTKEEAIDILQYRGHDMDAIADMRPEQEVDD